MSKTLIAICLLLISQACAFALPGEPKSRGIDMVCRQHARDWQQHCLKDGDWVDSRCPAMKIWMARKKCPAEKSIPAHPKVHRFRRLAETMRDHCPTGEEYFRENCQQTDGKYQEGYEEGCEELQ